MKNHFVICVALLAVPLLLCGIISTMVRRNTSQENDYPNDSWYYTDTLSDGPWDWNKISASEIYEVNNAAKIRAEYLLRQTSVLQLSLSQVNAFSNHNFISANLNGKRPYLVRALYFNKETGSFTIYSKGKKLWVEHGSLGHVSVPMKRQPLVVLLKVQPDKVFVTCSMDE